MTVDTISVETIEPESDGPVAAIARRLDATVLSAGRVTADPIVTPGSTAEAVFWLRVRYGVDQEAEVLYGQSAGELWCMALRDHTEGPGKWRETSLNRARREGRASHTDLPADSPRRIARASPSTSSPWHRGGDRAAFRAILDDAGVEVAFCPSYYGGPSLQEAQANAELITSGIDRGATPGPWTPELHPDGTWLVWSPERHIVAQAKRCSEGKEIADRIATARDPGERPPPPHERDAHGPRRRQEDAVHAGPSDHPATSGRLH